MTSAKRKMKTFAGNKSLEQIVAQCFAQGLRLDMRRYINNGDDHIVIAGGGGKVIYNTFNGRFFGTTDKGVSFSSDDTTHEREPWFQALLSFFYVEKEAA